MHVCSRTHPGNGLALSDNVSQNYWGHTMVTLSFRHIICSRLPTLIFYGARDLYPRPDKAIYCMGRARPPLLTARDFKQGCQHLGLHLGEELLQLKDEAYCCSLCIGIYYLVYFSTWYVINLCFCAWLRSSVVLVRYTQRLCKPLKCLYRQFL